MKQPLTVGKPWLGRRGTRAPQRGPSLSRRARVAVRPALVRTVRPMIPGKPEARFCARLSPWNVSPRSRSRPRTRRLRPCGNPTASRPRSPKSDHPYRRPDHLTRFHPSRRPPRARNGAERPRSTQVNPPCTMTRSGARRATLRSRARMARGTYRTGDTPWPCVAARRNGRRT